MAKIVLRKKFSPASVLRKEFGSQAGKLLAAMRKLLKSPDDSKVIQAASLHGCRLRDLGEMAGIFYKRNPVKPFLQQLQPCLDATHEILKQRKWQTLAASLKQDTPYAALFISQLKVRENDWREEIAFSIKYLDFKSAERLRKAASKAFPAGETACTTPKRWSRQQLLSLRKPQKTAFKERGQKALSQLASRLRYCALAMELFSTEFASLLPPARSISELLAAIEDAAAWSALEDFVIEFTGHTPLKGHVTFENTITKATRNACKKASGLRGILLDLDK